MTYIHESIVPHISMSTAIIKANRLLREVCAVTTKASDRLEDEIRKSRHRKPRRKVRKAMQKVYGQSLKCLNSFNTPKADFYLRLAVLPDRSSGEATLVLLLETVGNSHREHHAEVVVTRHALARLFQRLDANELTAAMLLDHLSRMFLTSVGNGVLSEESTAGSEFRFCDNGSGFGIAVGSVFASTCVKIHTYLPHDAKS